MRQHILETETPTHFVVSTGGKTQTIAKKGLPDATLNRIRSFSKGGTVPHYAAGGIPDDNREEAERIQQATPGFSETPGIMPEPSPTAVHPVAQQAAAALGIANSAGIQAAMRGDLGSNAPTSISGRTELELRQGIPKGGAIGQRPFQAVPPIAAVPSPAAVPTVGAPPLDVGAAKAAYDKATSDYSANPTPENLDKIQQSATAFTIASQKPPVQPAPGTSLEAAQTAEQQALQGAAGSEARGIQAQKALLDPAAQALALQDAAVQKAYRDRVAYQDQWASQLRNRQVDPKRWWNGDIVRNAQGEPVLGPDGKPERKGGLDWGNKALAYIGMILGGADAVASINQNIDKDIAAQRDSINTEQNALNKYAEQTGNLPAAEQAFRAQAWTTIQHQLESAAMGSKSLQVQQNAAAGIARAQQEASKANQMFATNPAIIAQNSAQATTGSSDAAGYSNYVSATKVAGNSPIGYNAWLDIVHPGRTRPAPGGAPGIQNAPELSPEQTLQDYPGAIIYDRNKQEGDPYMKQKAHIPGAPANIYGRLTSGGDPSKIDNEGTNFANVGTAYNAMEGFLGKHKHGAGLMSMIGQKLGIVTGDLAEAEQARAALLAALGPYNTGLSPTAGVEAEKASLPPILGTPLTAGYTITDADVRGMAALKDRLRKTFRQRIATAMPGVHLSDPAIDRAWNLGESGVEEAPAARPSAPARKPKAKPTGSFGFVPD